jgi:lipopolysaccharide transport system ATP-binding protein
MSNIAIRVENLSKQYRIGAAQNNKNLREALKDAFKAPFRRAGKLLRGHGTGAAELDETIWALKDVSFEIRRGEAVGIIGGNGAGKSTLLRIISRITEPTEGFAEMRGRMGSLLEVGTGFHAELTGRENIYLNGAILGMKKEEIRRKFDEIVSFSGVEKFIDTPVKHYSSGMYLRLAFAVAAHLEPEILIVDEVLAVGDTQFQKKCLNKMQDVEQEGRTVLFVSHNMQAVTRLCQRAILLGGGMLLHDGLSRQVVTKYLEFGLGTNAERKWEDPKNAPGNEVVRMLGVRVRTEDGQVSECIDIRQPFRVELEYEVLKPGRVLLASFGFSNENNVCMFVVNDRDPAWQRKPRAIGCYISTVCIPGNFFAEGTITVGAGIVTEDPFIIHCDIPDSVAFQVVDSLDGDSARGDYGGRFAGVIRPLLSWTTRFIPNQCSAMVTS